MPKLDRWLFWAYDYIIIYTSQTAGGLGVKSCRDKILPYLGLNCDGYHGSFIF